jgi:pyruvate,orthophosphate dikinase
MLGHRGCRLAITYPEIYRMQVRAIAEAAAEGIKSGLKLAPEIMIPLVGMHQELEVLRDRNHTVVNRVREVRTGLKMTQDELAERVEATRQTIISIEKGNYVPSVLLALRIASILEKNVEELFRYEKI